jgi:hypothetical protein
MSLTGRTPIRRKMRSTNQFTISRKKSYFNDVYAERALVSRASKVQQLAVDHQKEPKLMLKKVNLLEKSQGVISDFNTNPSSPA